MFDKLDNMLIFGKWYEKVFAWLAYAFMCVGGVSIVFLLIALIIFSFVEESIISSILLLWAIIGLPIATIKLVRDGIQNLQNRDNPYIIVKYSKIPHFTKMMGKSTAEKMIENETFCNYVSKSGKASKHIKISLSDKWVCILGGYFPVDLLCGYNKSRNELYTIDGMIIKLPRRARSLPIKEEIESFFEDRGKYYYKSIPPKAGLEFNTALRGPRSDLSKANWGRVRYLWEKAIMGSSQNYWKNNQKSQRIKPISKEAGIDTTIFERVLSDKEINRTVDAIRRKEIPVARYMDFNEYQNEFCVCNGVELLKNLGNDTCLEGVDFLFDCLGDVDEAYFLMAVNLLRTYPRKLLEKKLDDNAHAVFETGDVLRLAGILYLAKEIKYEIPYIKEIKENQDQDDAAKAVTEEAEDRVKKFEFDEQEFYGSDEVQVFDPSGVAYLEQE